MIFTANIVKHIALEDLGTVQLQLYYPLKNQVKLFSSSQIIVTIHSQFLIGCVSQTYRMFRNGLYINHKIMLCPIPISYSFMRPQLGFSIPPLLDHLVFCFCMISDFDFYVRDFLSGDFCYIVLSEVFRSFCSTRFTI